MCICTLIHFYLHYIDILASNERNYQYECFLLVKGEWSISQSIKFKFYVFSERACVCVWDSHGWNYISEIC